MSDGWFSLFAILVGLFLVVQAVSLVHEYTECNRNHGEMVQGVSWNGYVCVDEDK